MLELTVTGQKLTREDKTFVASKSQEILSVTFTFSSDWDGYQKVAVFYQDKSDPKSRFLDENGYCLVPWETMLLATPLFIGVYGLKGIQRPTTNFVQIPLSEGSYLEGDAPSEPTPDIYQQIVNIMQQQKVDATQAEAAQAEMDGLQNYIDVAAVDNVFTLDLSAKKSINYKIETADVVAKTITLLNIPATDGEIFIRLKYSFTSAITWFSGITWLTGAAPVFTAGKVYRLGFWTENGGTAWHGNCVGGW